MGTFLTFLKYLPDLISLVKTIQGWIQAGLTDIQIRANLKAFQSAELTATETKDNSSVEDIFRNPPSS